MKRVIGSLLLAAAAALIAGGCEDQSPTAPTDCTATVAPLTMTFDAPGGSAPIGVSIASGCDWTAKSNADWITLTGTTSGTAAATLTAVVAANAGAADRTATVTVAGKTVTVVQHGQAEPSPACTYSVSPQQAGYPPAGGTGSITVTTGDGCAWTASSAVNWMVITGPAQVSGPGAVAYTVASNADTASRTGTLTVADHVVTIGQEGDLAACTYSVGPVEFTPCLGSQELSATLTTQAACPWTASPNVDWITMVTGTSGLGSALLRFTVGSNFDAPRSGIVAVRWPTPTAGQNLHVAQAGCHYAVSTSAISAPSSGGSLGFDVFQESEPNTCGGPLQNACMWSAVSGAGWVVVTSSMPRFGDDHVSFTVEANPDAAARSTTIAVRDQIVRISQAGR